MEITAIALQEVAAGQSITFTETAVRGTSCIVHNDGSSITKLRGLTNQCNARFLITFSGNIEIPSGGTVEAISMAIATDGEALQAATMIITPAATGELQNVSAQAYVTVPRGCCSSISVKNTSAQAIDVQNSNLIITRVS